MKSYATFQPILPYFLLSWSREDPSQSAWAKVRLAKQRRLTWTTAWKNASTNTSGLKAWCGHCCKDSSEIFANVAPMLSFSPFGGSVTTLNDR